MSTDEQVSTKKKKKKSTAVLEVTQHSTDSFDWFQGLSGLGATSLTRLGLSTKNRVPVTFTVAFPEGSVSTFKHQYHVTSCSDDYKADYLAVYWGPNDQTIHVHCC